MPYSRRAMSLRPIKTEKHEGTWSLLGLNASTIQEVILVNATAGEPSAPTNIETGSHVKWIYIEFNLNGVDNSGTAQVFHWYIWKNPQGQLTPSSPATYDTAQKRHILKRGMEMLPEIPLGSGGTVQTKRVFVVKIPKGMQRFAELDSLELEFISTSASNINFCGISIFKEYK